METKDLCFVSDNLYIAFPDRVKAVHLRDAACAVAIVSINASEGGDVLCPPADAKKLIAALDGRDTSKLRPKLRSAKAPFGGESLYLAEPWNALAVAIGSGPATIRFNGYNGPIDYHASEKDARELVKRLAGA